MRIKAEFERKECGHTGVVIVDDADVQVAGKLIEQSLNEECEKCSRGETEKDERFRNVPF